MSNIESVFPDEIHEDDEIFISCRVRNLFYSTTHAERYAAIQIGPNVIHFLLGDLYGKVYKAPKKIAVGEPVWLMGSEGLWTVMCIDGDNAWVKNGESRRSVLVSSLSLANKAPRNFD